MSVGCKIIRDFKRPAPELTARFQNMAVANIDDNMGRTGAIDGAIRPIGRGTLLGTAFTVRVPQGDNLMFHAAMDLAEPGDAIMIDAGGFEGRAIFGELMATYCKTRGIRGIVCDGAIRDRDALAAMEGFMVYARAATPDGPYKNGPGEINVPVTVGGRVVYPGDIIVGDGDGVAVIRPESAAAIADATLNTARTEAGILEHILKDGTYIRPWVETKLSALGCEII